MLTLYEQQLLQPYDNPKAVSAVGVEGIRFYGGGV